MPRSSNGSKLSTAKRCKVRSNPVHRSWSTLHCMARWISSSVRGPAAHPLGDVVAGNDKVFSSIVLATQDDVRVRVAGVPVVHHRHPVQPRAQVGLQARHQVPGVGTQVFELFGGYDEAELVPILAPAFLESGGIRRIGEAQRPWESQDMAQYGQSAPH